MSVVKNAVATSRKEAADAARDILNQGGNAIDAAVAALMVQCIIEPSNVGFAGYGGSFAIYQAATGRVHTIDFDSRAPFKFDPARFNEEDANYGYLAPGPPGIVAGIDLALNEFGTLPWKTLSKSALKLAEDGIVVTPKLSKEFAVLLERFDADSKKAYFPDGVPALGTTWRQRDLAKVIRKLGDEGPSTFYTGDIARTIASQVQAHGGELAEEDFHRFHASIVEPLHINFRGFDVYTPPLPSAGLTSLSILKTLEQFDVAKLQPWGARYFELFTEAAKLCWEERFQYFGDPDFVNVPVADLLSEERAVARAATIRKGRVPASQPKGVEPAHTVNIVVIDAAQNVVSVTATHGGDFGSHVAIDGLGLMLGHGMSKFAFKGPSPNFPEAGKRMQHNMAPVIILRDGKPYAGIGIPGGRKIVTVTAQLVLSVLDFKVSPEQAVAAPRVHTEGEEPLLVSEDTPPAVVEELKLMGHAVTVKDPVADVANIAIIDQKTGGVTAAASSGPPGVALF